MSNSILVVGDLHGNIWGLDKLIRTLRRRNVSITQVFCLGDTNLYNTQQEAKTHTSQWNKYKTYINEYLTTGIPSFNIPIHVMTGNNDDVSFLNSSSCWSKNIMYQPTGSVSWVDETTAIININGIYSKTNHNKPREKVPFKYYIEEEFERIEALAKNLYNNGATGIILLGHPGPKGKITHPRAANEGRFEISTLINRVQPDIYIHGHHHVNYTNDLGHKLIVGLGNFARNQNSYFLISRG